LQEEPELAELEVGPRFAFAGAGSATSPSALEVTDRGRASSGPQRRQGSGPADGGGLRSAPARESGTEERPPAARSEEGRTSAIVEHRLQRILVPTDYSKHSVRALGFACQLADRLGLRTKVDVLHVTVPPVDYLPIDEWIWGEAREPE